MEMTSSKLKEVALQGSEAVAKDLEKLCTYQVEATVEQIEEIELSRVSEYFTKHRQKAIVTFAKLFKGPEGVAILMMTREEALLLVDLLNGQDLGTTGVLRDIDRSAIKETLNILSNSYVNAMANEFGMDVMVGPPQMVTLERLVAVLPDYGKKDKHSILFDTKISVAKKQLNASLLFLFDAEFAEKLQHLV